MRLISGFSMSKKIIFNKKHHLLTLCFFVMLILSVYGFFKLIMQNDKNLYVSMSSLMEELSYPSECLNFLPKNVFFLSGTDSVGSGDPRYASGSFRYIWYSSFKIIVMILTFLTLIPDFSKYELNKKNVKIIQKDQKRLEMFKADEHHSVFCSEDEDSCFIMKNALDLDKNLLEDYWSGLWFLSKKTDSLKLFFYCVNR